MEEKNFPRIFEDFGLLVLSLTLFLGGGFILYLKIPFWGLFLGIASVQAGIVFSIYTFEAFTKRISKKITEDYKTIPCLMCKKINYVPKYQNTTICDSCQIKIVQASKSFMIVVFALFSLTSLVYLAKNNQDIRQNASGNKYYCEVGTWNPGDCSCATLEKFTCPEGLVSRRCGDNFKYCCKKDDSTPSVYWECQKTE